jgi:hypothetical protein
MRSTLLVCALLFAGTAASAQNTPAPAAAPATKLTAGTMLHDVKGTRLGAISRVNADNSVSLILDGRMVTIPADKLSTDGSATTTLTKRDVANLP